MNIEKWLPRIEFPELFFGFVAPIGAEIDSTLVAFRDYFHALDYKIVEIKVTDLFPVLARYVPPKDALDRSSELSRYRSFIAYGDELRDRFGDAILAASIINRIVKRRLRLPQPKEPFSKTVYLLHQFKRKEEIDLLRSV